MTRRRRLTILFSAGVFLLLYAFLGALSWQQQAEQKKLGDQIKVAQRVLASQTAQDYEELEAEYETVRQSIPTATLTPGDVISAVIGIAQASGFNTELTKNGDSDSTSIKYKTGLATETVGKTKYGVLSFSVEVTGEYEKVLDFVGKLGSVQALQTLAINRVDVTLEEDRVTAAIDFVVYTRT